MAGWLLTGLYRVAPDQAAVVSRFGAVVGRAGPGLNYHLPAPIAQATLISTGVNRLEIGAQDLPSDGQILTADRNLVNVDYVVRWRADDAARYLAGAADPGQAIRLGAEAAMRAAVGRMALQDVLGPGRTRLQAQARTTLQQGLDRIGAAVSVLDIQVRDASLPQAATEAAAHDIAAAGQDIQSGLGDANAYKVHVIGDAKVEADRLVSAAEGYRAQLGLEAQGEAQRFAQIDAAYRKAPAVTRSRLYIETMERVLRGASKVVEDRPGGASVTLPAEAFRPRVEADAAAASGQAQTGSGQANASQTNASQASPSQARPSQANSPQSSQSPATQAPVQGDAHSAAGATSAGSS